MDVVPEFVAAHFGALSFPPQPQIAV